jgi:hypothetical protein
MRAQLLLIWALAFLLVLGENARAQNTRFLNSPAVTCGATATQLVVARQRNAVTVAPPSGGSTVYVGSNANVAASGANIGFPIAAGGAMTFQPYNGPLWCIVSTGTQSTNVVESY